MMNKTITLLMLLIFVSGSCGAYEDFTTFTEIDPDSEVSKTSTVITATNVEARDTNMSVYKSYGAGYFGINFTHEFEFNFVSGQVKAAPTLYTIADATDYASTPTSGINIYMQIKLDDNTVYRVAIENIEETQSDTTLTDTFSVNTPYYVRVVRSGSGTTWTVYIYSDVARATLVDSLTIEDDITTYQYIWASASIDLNVTTRLASWTVSKLFFRKRVFTVQ